ncbi:MAG: O-antigen ligase family protein [Thermoleophilia bacterium]
MTEPASPPTGRAPSAVTTAALLVAGAVVTAGLTAFALRGAESRSHIAIALGLPVVAGVGLLLVIARDRLARLPMAGLLAAAVIALPALAIIGPVLSLPGFRQLFAFRVAAALVGLAGLLWLVLVHRRWRLEAATYVFLFGAWFCWLTVALAWAPDPQAGLRYLFLLLGLGAVAVATASAGTSRRRLRYLLLGLAAVLGLSLLIATAEWTLRVHLPTAAAFYTHRRRPAAFFVNTNDFGTYLALCWPFVLLLPALRRSAATILLIVAGLVASLAALLFTGSRTSLLAIALETVVVGAVIAVRAGRRTRFVVAVLVVVALLGAGLLLVGRGGLHFKKFDITKIASQVRSGQGSGAVRFDLQVAGLRAAASRLFLGVGPGNAEIVVARQNPTFTVLNLHDWWLEVFVDGGLPGLLLFVTIYLLLLASMVRVARYARDALLAYLGAATAIALVGFSVAIVGPSTAITFSPMAILFGLGLAVLIRARREVRELQAGLTPTGSHPPGGPPDLLDSRAHPDGAARTHDAARGPTLSGGDAQPAGGGR